MSQKPTSLPEHRSFLEGCVIRSLDLIEVEGRIIVNSLTLSNGYLLVLAPSTKGVAIHKLEEINVKQSSAGSHIENRAQARPAIRKAKKKRTGGELYKGRRVYKGRKSPT